MEVHTFAYSQYYFGKLMIDPSRTVGRGGALAPAIHLSVGVEFWGANLETESRPLLIQELSGTAVIDHAGGFALEITPMAIQRIFGGERREPTHRAGDARKPPAARGHRSRP